MKNNIITAIAAGFLLTVFPLTALAQHGEKDVTLHVNPRWSECSFQLDPSLTQEAWRQFTREAGLVIYFRPLSDARPMGVGNYELSILNWQTAFDDTDPAWNDTFVHPDSVHWLKEGDRLQIPGFVFRAGVSERIDVNAYWVKNPGANYGFWGGQVQYAFVNDIDNALAASARLSFVSLYGPYDFDFTTYGMEVLASKEFGVYSDWVFVSTYAGISAYLSRSHETAPVVDLKDERILGMRGMIGVATRISFARLALEYNAAAVNSISFKVGVGF